MKKILLTILLLLTGCGHNINYDKPLGAKSVIIDGHERSFTFTDNNEKENLIIETERKDYYSMNGGVVMYMAVTNISGVEQDINVVISTKDKIIANDIKLFLGTNQVLSGVKKVYSSTTEEYVKENIYRYESEWADINNIEYSEINKEEVLLSKDIEIKDTAETKKVADKTLIKKDDTKYYKVLFDIPKESNGEEWFIEAYGSKGAYGHLDPNGWTYEQTFNDLNVGTLNGQDSWANSKNNNFYVSTAGTPYEGTKHVANTTGTDGVIIRSVSAVTYGTIYISLSKPVLNEGTNYVRLLNEDGLSDITVRLWKSSAGNLLVYDGNSDAYVDTGFDFSAGTYFRVGIAFEYTSGGYEGLSVDTFKVNINDGSWSSAYGVERDGAGEQVEGVRLDNYDLVSGTYYIDYISPNYSDGGGGDEEAPKPKPGVIIF